MDRIELELLIGAFFVTFSAFERFNTPSTSRSSTTALRYYLSAIAYVIIALGSYSILCQYPDLLKSIGAETLSDYAKDLPPALMAALFLTTFLEKMPFFAHFDKRLREQLHRIANIPKEARELGGLLRQSAFSVPDSMRAKLKSTLIKSGFQEKHITFDSSESPQSLWIKIAALMEYLATWQTNGSYYGFMDEFGEKLEMFRGRYNHLSEKAIRCFRLSDDLSPICTDAHSLELIADFRSDFNEQADELFKDICDFISRGILRSCFIGSDRFEALRKMGFQEQQLDSGLSWNQLINIFLMVAAVLGLGMVSGNYSKHNLSFGDQLLKVMMVATTYCVAICCALYSKKWGIAKRGHDGERPTASYLIVGILAGTLSLPIKFIFNFMISDFSIGGAFDKVSSTFPWILITFVTAVITSFNIDNECDANFKRRQRWIEGGLQAVVTAVTAVLVCYWLNKMESLWLIALLSASNGFLLGYNVPTWYRNARHRQVQRADHNSEQISLLRAA